MVVSRIPSPVYCSLRMLFKAELGLPFAFTVRLTYSSQPVKCSVDDTINFKKLWKQRKKVQCRYKKVSSVAAL